ncbi:uncharacterized protein LOC120367744 isoform X2 [Saimiri boliviensis]|uniref:uncharacterized protein LOC120367744 isoform X2 n=1 Tax=Saimiri boliviensis TaxID=27679 RepID=UPI003D776E32
MIVISTYCNLHLPSSRDYTPQPPEKLGLQVPATMHSYLANDMEEDDEASKQAIFYFLYGKNLSQRPLFQKLRFQFFCSMCWRAWVSPQELEENTGPRGDADFQQEVYSNANGRHWEGREEPFVQIIWKNLEVPGLF